MNTDFGEAFTEPLDNPDPLLAALTKAISRNQQPAVTIRKHFRMVNQ